MKKHRLIALSTLLLVFFSLLFHVNCHRKNEDTGNEAEGQNFHLANYVGRESCKECHALQYELFQGSDHDMAMQVPDEETVLGDFNDAYFTHFDVTSHFYKKEGKYYVHTQGPEGVMQDYEIKYTFGVRPLQQYLIEFPGGRYQCLPLCWDTRPKSQGGQKWFHVYGNEHIPPDDVLFWTKVNQNWNYMCAECHSTNLRKNYDYHTKTYNTTWSEVDVSCEACHGPGSEHLKWAEIVDKGGNPESIKDMGLAIRLKDPDNAVWIFDPDSVTARRSVPPSNDLVVQMCARCHSRRSVLTEDYFHGGSLLNTHWPSLLETGLYYPDGQILDEVYVYASFLQSKMYKAGVSCKDCHEPHSGKVYVLGNALCYRCHMASEYGGRKHHFHDPEKEGALCYECHMHERTYMQVDPRRDHSIRIPRPDLSVEMGTPNACNQCHPDKSNEWSVRYMKEWYGKDVFDDTHYGEIFYAARNYAPNAVPELIRMALDTVRPPMVRATAIYLLGNYPEQKSMGLIEKTIKDPNPLLRYASLNAAQNWSREFSLQNFLPLLNDTTRLVRIMTANLLSAVPQESIPENYREPLRIATEQYKASLLINSDHPNTHMNFGNLYLNSGDYAKAEASYKEAIELGPELFAPYINLADLYRREGRDGEGEKLLKEALEKHPSMAPIHYSLGLLEVRKGNTATAVDYLRQAALLAPEEAHYSYVYAIALNSRQEPLEAINFLETALKTHPYDKEILYALSTLNMEQGKRQKAYEYARKLSEYYPDDGEVRQLMNAFN